MNLSPTGEHTFDFENELGKVERFVEILIRAVKRRGHLVEVRADARQHDHSGPHCLRVLPYRLAHFPSVFPRHHYIENDYVRALLVNLFKGHFSVRGSDDVAIDTLKALEQNTCQLGIIVRNK